MTTATSPAHTAFTKADKNYETAIFALREPAPNERIDVRSRIATAKMATQTAIDTLAPFTSDPDRWVSAPAIGSISQAQKGVSLLNSAWQTIESGAQAPQIPVSQSLEMARNAITSAQSTLWQERVGG